MNAYKHPFLLASAFVFISLFFVFDSSIASAATYYTCNNASTCGSGWVTGNDANSCNSKSTACGTIRAGILKMLGGDELVIGDGTYTGTSNRIYGLPTGTAQSYTKIYAENDWGVTLSATGNNIYEPPVDIRANYVLIRGLKVINFLGEKFSLRGDYIKVIRSATDGAGGSSGSFVVYGNYGLVEESYSWGGPNRYVFRTSHAYGGGDYAIFRRNVCRWDYSNTNEPQSCFANYDTSFTFYQNNIAIDGIDNRAQDHTYDGLKGFFTPNGASETHFDGSISLNMEGAGFWIEDSPVANVTLTNCVAWDNKNHANASTDGYPPRTFYSRAGSGPLVLNHCTFGSSGWTSRVIDSDLGTEDTIKNSIIANFTAITDYAEDGFNTSNYNDYYGNAGGRNKSGGMGPNSITINPFTNGLSYLPRIEDGSTLKNSGEAAGQIGAQITKRVGVSGTLYGEQGWNETTSEDLWPFPNEDVIKRDMASFYKSAGQAYTGSPEMIGARGFAASGNGLYGGPITLTSYIWEYLGNPCPADICNYGTQTFHLADTNQNNRIEMRELIAFIGRWKSGQAILADVMSALGKWMSGS